MPSSSSNSIQVVKARVSTHNGVPAVIFKAKEFYGAMTHHCRLTLVGKFLKSRHTIEKIRSAFAEKISTKRTVNIGAFDFRTVFMDFKCEQDYKNVFFRRMVEIDEQQMWLEQWTPDFKSDEDAPFAPVWVLLPGLPLNCHYWDYIKQILSPVGVPQMLDNATIAKNRPSLAKARVIIDLTKPRVEKIWIGLEDEDTPLRGFYQKLDYEQVPKYCKHYKRIGHSLEVCRWAEKKKQAQQNKKNQKMEEKELSKNKGNERSEAPGVNPKNAKEKDNNEKASKNAKNDQSKQLKGNDNNKNNKKDEIAMEDQSNPQVNQNNQQTTREEASITEKSDDQVSRENVNNNKDKEPPKIPQVTHGEKIEREEEQRVKLMLTRNL
ncbi:J protein JJJ2-like [Lycium ferocissimum]|uniref:J protein JJJ2-like n=1 Tax=Lycium ferocissimum TaxID=112874 RepID=UPI0028159320|nr:J protein JJJ2-like [Lycium ferocissimum]